MTRYDIVVYGATGFTGTYILQRMVTSDLLKDVTFAIAGRSEEKLRKVLDQVSKKSGKDIRSTPIILADSSDEASLAEMAKQATVIINAVGPYRLYGEAVVRAAVENGASHVDISGEAPFLEKMQAKYSELAKEKGVFIVGACGWDSIPCDLGVHFLKRNFGGDLNHAETFVQAHKGPEGYVGNTGTYQTIILGMQGMLSDGLGKIRKQIMPEKIVKGTVKPPWRNPLFQIPEPRVSGWALPFPGCDGPIVQRSQYYRYFHNNERPVQISTYVRVESLLAGILLAVWASTMFVLAQISFTRKYLQDYPEICSFNQFKGTGPTEKQIAGASFTYWLVGTGYSKKVDNPNELHEEKPDRKVIATCKGPDMGYMATSGCVISSALAILKDRKDLPKDGGVYTTAAAFGDTKIYDYLKTFGVTFQIEEEKTL